MKKTIKAIIAGTTVFLASTFIPACTVATLSVPYGMTIDDSYRMTWNDVENARGYVISIKGDDGVVFEDEARRPTYSLEDLEEGDYEIRIKADGGDSQYADSEWSEVVYFHREYENGCIYTLINNDTEYEVSGYGTSSGTVEVGGLYRGKPVTQIGDSAFRNSRNLESITLLDSVTHIGENAFFNCNALKAVVLSEGRMARFPPHHEIAVRTEILAPVHAVAQQALVKRLGKEGLLADGHALLQGTFHGAEVAHGVRIGSHSDKLRAHILAPLFPCFL